jgi:hypothetical protein
MWRRGSGDCPKPRLPPSAMPAHVFRPVSGLAGGDELPLGPAPSRACAQWPHAVPWPAYRCGGSAGFAADLHLTAHRLPVSALGRTPSGHLKQKAQERYGFFRLIVKWEVSGGRESRESGISLLSFHCLTLVIEGKFLAGADRLAGVKVKPAERGATGLLLIRVAR